MCTVSVCCAVLVVGCCVVCAVRWCFRVCSCWGFCYLWSVGVSVRLLPSAAPVISSPNKLHKSSHCLPNLTNRFFCALIPSQKSSPAFLSTIICPPFLSLSLTLPLSFPPLSLFSLVHSLFCCFAAQHGRLSPLPLVVLPWPCDDCVLYQSVTCVLAQPLPVPCTHRVDPCAAAASTGRRAAWPPLCRPTELSTLQWWEHLLTFMWLTPLAYRESEKVWCCYDQLKWKLSLQIDEWSPCSLTLKLPFCSHVE